MSARASNSLRRAPWPFTFLHSATILSTTQLTIPPPSAKGTTALDAKTEMASTRDMLTGLPVEVLELISEEMGAKDLLPWRLTCRAAFATSVRPFNRRVVGERAFIYSNEDSIRRLTEIAQDPGKRRHLKTITLSLASLIDREDNDRELEKWLTGEGVSSSREMRHRMRARRARYDEVREADDQFCLLGAPISLIRILHVFQRHGIDVGITVSNEGLNVPVNGVDASGVERGLAPWGYERICDRLGHRRCMDVDSDRYDLNWTNLLRSLRASKHAPSSLLLGDLSIGVDPHAFYEQWLKVQGPQKPFRNLTSLRLTLSVGSDAGPPFMRDIWKSRTLRFQRALSLALTDATNLQSLGLTVGSGPADDECLGKSLFQGLMAVREKAFNSLRMLELDGHRINVYEMMHFVLARKSSLRKVSLRWITGCESRYKDLQRLQMQEEDDNFSRRMRGWFERTLHKDVVVAWDHVYDGKPWSQSERLKAMSC